MNLTLLEEIQNVAYAFATSVDKDQPADPVCFPANEF